MAYVNKVILIGNLTRDPELRQSKSGDLALCDFSLAVNNPRSSGRDRQADRTDRGDSGRDNRPDDVLYIDVRAFGRQAELIHQYLRKGRQIYVEGRLQLDRWEQDGQPRSRHRVLLENFQFLSDGSGSGSSNSQSSGRRDEDFESDAPPSGRGSDRGNDRSSYSARAAGNSGYRNGSSEPSSGTAPARPAAPRRTGPGEEPLGGDDFGSAGPKEQDIPF